MRFEVTGPARSGATVHLRMYVPGLFLLLLACFSLVRRPVSEVRAFTTASQLPTVRISMTAAGLQANGVSDSPAISGNGRYVAFVSRANNLASGDTNGRSDIFVVDRQRQTVVRASLSGSGAQGNGDSFEPSISGDGRFVSYTSKATNLVPVSAGQGTRESYRGPGIYVYLRDCNLQVTSLVSVSSLGAPSDRHAWLSDISAGGGFVTFSSHSTALMPFDLNGIKRDPYLHNRLTRQTWYVDIADDGGNVWGGGSWSRVSGDGSLVVFRSIDGSLVPGDTNLIFDIFVYDHDTHLVRRASKSSAGQETTRESYDPDISADGSVVVFSSAAALVDEDHNGKIDVYAHDLESGQTTLVSRSTGGIPGNDDSTRPSVSANGRYVAFESAATNLDANDRDQTRDIFVHDRASGHTRRVSLSTTGLSPNGMSIAPSISDDGRTIAFASSATNLVPGDTNGKMDIFIVSLDSAEGGGTLSGRITDASDGLGVAGVTVRTDQGHVAITGSSGDYQFDALPPGEYVVVPVMRHRAFEPSQAVAVIAEDQGGSDQTAVLDFISELEPTYALSGRIYRQDGSPVVGVRVGADAGRTVLTNSEGEYRIGGLFAGAYLLTASRPGIAFTPMSVPVNLPDDGFVFDFVAGPPTSISGKVTTYSGSGIRGVKVSAGHGLMTTTSGTGAYRFPDVAPGSYNVTPFQKGSSFQPATLVVQVPPQVTAANFRRGR